MNYCAYSAVAQSVWGHQVPYSSFASAIEHLSKVSTSTLAVSPSAADSSPTLGNFKLWRKKWHRHAVYCGLVRYISQPHWGGSGWELRLHSQEGSWLPHSVLLLSERSPSQLGVPFWKNISAETWLFCNYIQLCLLAFKPSRQSICWRS